MEKLSVSYKTTGVINKLDRRIGVKPERNAEPTFVVDGRCSVPGSIDGATVPDEEKGTMEVGKVATGLGVRVRVRSDGMDSLGFDFLNENRWADGSVKDDKWHDERTREGDDSWNDLFSIRDEQNEGE